MMMVLSTVACKKITPETRIAQMADYLATHENQYAAKLNQYEADKRVDYLTLEMAKALGAEELWTLETAGANSLIAEFSGREKENRQLSLISASLDDPDACATVVSILEAFKNLKIYHKNDIRVIFYDTAKDSAGIDGLTAINQEMYDENEIFAFDIEVASRDSLPGSTFFISDKPVFAERIAEVIPPYLAPLGEYRFQAVPYPDPTWPLKGPVYRFHLSGNKQKDAAALAAVTYLLNF